MFSSCADPSSLEGFSWLMCYLTTGKHLDFYWSFVTVLVLLAVTAPSAMAFGFGGAMAARSQFLPLRIIGKGYTAMVRGVPDIVFFLFFVIALDQGIEWMTHKIVCPDWTEPIRNGLEFRVCPAAKVPPNSAAQIWHSLYGFALGGFYLCHRVRGLCRQCALRRDAGRAAGAAGNRRKLWHEPRSGVSPHSGAADVGLCPARPVEPVDDPDQGDAAFVPAWGSKTSSIGHANWAGTKAMSLPIRTPIGGFITFCSCWCSIWQ